MKDIDKTIQTWKATNLNDDSICWKVQPPLKQASKLPVSKGGQFQPVATICSRSRKAWRFCAWYVWRGSCASFGWCASFPSCAWLKRRCGGGVVLLVVGCCRSNWLGVDHPCCWGFYSFSNLKGTLNAWYIDPYLMGHSFMVQMYPWKPSQLFQKKPVPWICEFETCLEEMMVESREKAVKIIGFWNPSSMV